MKKIGVITLYDLNNYGNRLQCFALQRYIKNLGIEIENIINYNTTITYNARLFFEGMIRNICFINKKNIHMKNRKKNFIEFDKNISYSKYKIVNNNASKKINNNYDYFIVGSDQVWNTSFSKQDMDCRFLNFSDDYKRIAYAASFGTSVLPANFKEKYFEELNKFKAISVRELEGKNILDNEIKNKTVEVLIDPTMLLNNAEWEKYTSKPSFDIPEKYIFCYFLGGISEERKQKINKLAKDKNYKIINILDKNSEYYECGPREFLYLIKNSQLVCTDSFHSCVFSIIFDKNFVIFSRDGKKQSMNSRINTLLNKFNIQNRYFNDDFTEENLNHDYTEAYKILEIEREKSRKFLEKALDVEEHN